LLVFLSSVEKPKTFLYLHAIKITIILNITKAATIIPTKAAILKQPTIEQQQT